MCSKLAVFLTFVLMLGLVGASATWGGVLDVKVAADSDDAEENVATGTIDLASSDLEFIYDNNVNDAGKRQVIGIRFTNVQIPKGEVITRAYVRLDADDIDNDYHTPDAHMLIEGQLDPNPGTFEATANNVSARPRTIAQVPWSPTRWMTVHQKEWTSDITSIIQEIVNQESWAAGNALVVIFSQDPTNPSAGIRESESFNGAGTNIGQSPTLHVEFGEAYAPDEIYREAESADVLGSSWRSYDSPASLGGKHIGSENGDGDENNAAPAEKWIATYNFEAVGGVYKVLLRAQKNDSDSFWVRITGATSQTYEHPAQAGTGWVRFNEMGIPGNAMGWDEVHSNDHNNDVVYWVLPAGPHTIEIAKREDGVLLDSFIITNAIAIEQATLPGPGASGLDIRIASGSDDAEQHLGDGSMEIGSSDLEIPYEDAGNPATDEQVIGLRFVNVLISNRGPIAGAYVEIEVDAVNKEGSANPVNLIIEGELTPNAAAFAAVANNITDRAVTAAKVKWSIPPWTAADEKFRSPEISSILREIVSQDGWGPGNALVLIVRDDKDNPSTGLREAESYDGESGAAPLLHLATLVPLAKDPKPANGATGVAFAPSARTYFSTDVPKNIPDFKAGTGTNIIGEVTSTLSVPDSLRIPDLNVELDIRKPGNSADLDVHLKAPDGTRVELFTDVGIHSGDDFKNTILDDEASTSITSGSGSFTGIYKPEGRLSDFDSRDSKGTWELRIRDDWYRGPGTLNSWRLVIEEPLLGWMPPGGAASQNVYFADNFEDVNNSAASAFMGNLASSVSTLGVGALALGQTYYWRVDAIAADGKVQSTGNIWSFTTAVGNVVVDRRISDGNDDAEQHLGNGSMDIGSSDLEIPYEDAGNPATDEQVIGLRFVNIPLDKSAEVSGAFVELEVDAVDKQGSANPVNLIIEGELVPDAAAFAAVANNITDRASRTTAKVKWSIPPWTAVDRKFQSPDISSIIREILSQEGWVGGNALVLIISDDKENPSTGLREAESYNGEAGAAPLLHIDAITEAATKPSPADGAVDVPLNTALSWTAGMSATWRNVYFGTSSSPAKLEATTGRSVAPKLEPSTTYYWKVDEVEANGTIHAGTVWSFTTPPGEATQPNPADFAAGVALDATLSWKPGVTAVSHDVSFGTSSPPPFIGNQAAATYNPGGLALGGIYYWRIDEIDAKGKKYIGDIWMFKAPREGTGTILREVWEGIGAGTSVSDLTSNANYPAKPSFSDERTSFEVPINFADNFGSRIHGWLHPDTSGDYKFWIASDDNSELWLSTNELPANAVLISKVTAWTDSRQFDDPDVVPSGPIHLEGGQKYYIRALYKEGGGGDNCAVAWQGPDSPTRQVISGYYLSPFVALWAEGPDPVNGATVAQTWVMLGWTAGVTAASHDVYIGTAPDALEFQVNQTATILTIGLPGLPLPGGLVPGTTYYWRVDEVEADGTTKHQGAVWSFSVPPDTAYNPNPADGATGVATNVVLRWTAGLGAKLHSVYFGDNLDTVTNAAGAPPLPVTTFNPGALEQGKTYYWRVDEFNPPKTVKGKVWSFTTVQPPPPPAL